MLVRLRSIPARSAGKQSWHTHQGHKSSGTIFQRDLFRLVRSKSIAACWHESILSTNPLREGNSFNFSILRLRQFLKLIGYLFGLPATLRKLSTFPLQVFICHFFTSLRRNLSSHGLAWIQFMTVPRIVASNFATAEVLSHKKEE